MTEPISTTILTAFVIGLVMGILDEINKKITAVIWILAVVCLVISISIQSPTSYANGLNWGVSNWIAVLITVNLSSFIGKLGMRSVKETFK